MADVNSYLFSVSSQFQATSEEKSVSDIVLNEAVSLSFGDNRLNNIAALTYNSQQCDRIFSLITRTLNPQEFPWKTLYKSLLLLKTIILYGSEYAIDSALDLDHRGAIKGLTEFNSVTTPKSWLSSITGTAGTDYGAPVREIAKEVANILSRDENIRNARQGARGEDSLLIPIGDTVPESKNQIPAPPTAFYGQGVTTSVGAGYGLEAIPGMYEGRPERYFDKDADERRTKPTGDHQFTREAFAPPLIDLLDTDNDDSIPNLPEAQYLPALERQKQLERQLAEQKAQLDMLMAMASKTSQPPSLAQPNLPVPPSPLNPMAANHPLSLLSYPTSQPGIGPLGSNQPMQNSYPGPSMTAPLAAGVPNNNNPNMSMMGLSQQPQVQPLQGFNPQGAGVSGMPPMAFMGPNSRIHEQPNHLPSVGQPLPLGRGLGQMPQTQYPSYPNMTINPNPMSGHMGMQGMGVCGTYPGGVQMAFMGNMSGGPSSQSSNMSGNMGPGLGTTPGVNNQQQQHQNLPYSYYNNNNYNSNTNNTTPSPGYHYQQYNPNQTQQPPPIYPPQPPNLL